MQQLNLMTGQTKEEIAIDFIREHEPPEEGYFLGFSGGKDSVVLYDLTVKARVKFQAYYSATGIDPPELVKFIRDYYPDVIWKRPKKSFWQQLQIWKLPTRQKRWCCDFLKKTVSAKINKHRLLGIRREESSARAKYTNPGYNKRHRYYTYFPIFDWLEWEVWDHIESNNIRYCCLYDEGFSRLGCVICPFHSFKLHELYRERWPKYFKTFEIAARKLWDNLLCVKNMRSGAINYKTSETDFDEFLQNWYRGK